MKKCNKKIKVLQLGNAGSLYGAERWILALINYLDVSKIETLVASIRDDPSLDAPLCVEAEKLGFSSYVFDIYGKINFSAVNKLREFILNNDIDIIHTHHYKTDMIGLLATRGTPCLIISTPHGWTKKPDPKLFVYELLNRTVFPFFDAVVPLSEGIIKPLCRIPFLKRKLHLIENGVDTQEIEKINSVAPEMCSLKKNGFFVIGYIGRLTPGKGLDVLLKVMADYADPCWKVVIVGEGEQEAELKTLVKSLKINDKVIFCGFRSDRLSFLKGFDVFALPSRSEGIPRCLMEAMSAGIPVVASDITGCRNLVDGKTTGLLFPVDNPERLADSIKRLWSDTELRGRICHEGRVFIQNNFSATRMAQQYEDLFFDLCNRLS